MPIVRTIFILEKDWVVTQSEPINEPINNSLKVAVSSRQMRIISAIKRNPFMNREELAEETNLSIATLRREIGILRQEGYLGREGSNKNGQWIILKKGQVYLSSG